MLAEQGELFDEGKRKASDAQPGVPAPRAASAPADIWLQRSSLIVLVIFCFYIGALLTVLPWSPRYWDSNGWMLTHPVVGNFLGRGWVRGVVSGMGLLDVWIGVSELLHYRDFRA